jgi:hypothetical protein
MGFSSSFDLRPFRDAMRKAAFPYVAFGWGFSVFILANVVISTIFLIRFVEIRNFANAGFFAFLVAFLLVVIVPFTLFLLTYRVSAVSLSIDEQGCSFQDRSGRTWVFSWADRRGRLEIMYGSLYQGPWFQKTRREIRSLIFPWYTARPLVALSKEAEIAIQLAAKSHGFSVIKGTYMDYWYNQVQTHVVIFGPEAERPRRHWRETMVPNEALEENPPTVSRRRMA